MLFGQPFLTSGISGPGYLRVLYIVSCALLAAQSSNSTYLTDRLLCVSGRGHPHLPVPHRLARPLGSCGAAGGAGARRLL